jgi:hypothetical protein
VSQAEIDRKAEAEEDAAALVEEGWLGQTPTLDYTSTFAKRKK